MKKATRFAFALALMAICLGLWAQYSVSGDWVFKMNTPNGDVEAPMVLKVDGAKLSGSITMNNRKLDITEGSVDGKNLKMTIKRERPDGGVMVYQMSGTVDGSEIKGMTKTEMGGQEATQEWTAKRK
jgi:hypothetical protein